MQSKFAQSMRESPPLIQFQKHFEIPACYILARISFFRARIPYLTKCD